ncbi:hypothetical protein V8E51_007619 [Hyaloscypha variabilis]
MKFSTLGLMAGLAASAAAEDLLFVDTFQYDEYIEATTTLGYTAKVVTEAEWNTMTSADFAAFKAIVIADPDCAVDPTDLDFLASSNSVWGPAVQGNIVLIGTDPTFHDDVGKAGATTLIDNAIKFAASGTTSTGQSQTGLYFALSCYYQSVDNATVDALSYFGDFEVRGNLDCYNTVHIVASSPALGTLDDAALSDWSCSVHEAFSVYPSVGVNGFQALAIAQNIIGAGSQTFADGTIGLPYIISRGATPSGCGNGIWQPTFGEECDDGKNNGVLGDPCSISCKCLSGRPAGNGTCLPPLVSSSSSSSAPPPVSTVYSNHSTTVTDTVVSTTTFCPGTYVTPTPPKTYIIGVEVIVYIEIIENCKTLGLTETVTEYITSTGSSYEKPIWNTDLPGYPCYSCALSSAGLTYSGFITASVTTCSSPPPSYTYTPPNPVIVLGASSSPYTLSTYPAVTVGSSETVYVVAATSASPHVHVQGTVYPTTTIATYATYATYAPSATPYPTSKNNGTLTPYTGGAGKVEVGLAAVAGLLLAAVVGL